MDDKNLSKPERKRRKESKAGFFYFRGKITGQLKKRDTYGINFQGSANHYFFFAFA